MYHRVYYSTFGECKKTMCERLFPPRFIRLAHMHVITDQRFINFPPKVEKKVQNLKRNSNFLITETIFMECRDAVNLC